MNHTIIICSSCADRDGDGAFDQRTSVTEEIGRRAKSAVSIARSVMPRAAFARKKAVVGPAKRPSIRSECF